MFIQDKKQLKEHIVFIRNLNKEISEMRTKPANETYLDILLIASKLIKYKKETGINLLCK